MMLPGSTFGGQTASLRAVMQVSDIRERLNQFLHRQNIRKLSLAERALAREWCLDLIRREHPDFDEEQRERFYENLIEIRIVPVDEWAQRMGARAGG